MKGNALTASAIHCETYYALFIYLLVWEILCFRLVTTDEDNKRLKIEMSELRAKHRLEIERTANLKEEEMNEVHKRLAQSLCFTQLYF